ncbi:hypothetical protein [Halorubrum sp. Ea8]|uniref:hypothetical protein n=1 Tax=Halorubrum sp. Ea8 TaxID=1383841 RepID=UPI000B991F1A|nr:hypothetical protein [Halorubrum sp. Ea8]OYR50133.1 hypothetical protein DJ74_07230 [Halorubrum sp. Ea8]
MANDDASGEPSRARNADRPRDANRRGVLRGVAAAGAAIVWGSSTVAGKPGNGNGGSDSGGGKFPPKRLTEYGRPIKLGKGIVRTFTKVTPSGETEYHGVEFDRAALEALPSAEELKNAAESSGHGPYADKYNPTGEALEVHYKYSLQFFVPFPDTADTPFTFLGLNWNPGGHFGGKGAWLKPHFDIHFHMLDPATVDAVEGPRLPPYDTGNGEYTSGSPAPDFDGKVTDTNFDYDQLPEGYARAPDPVADQRYIRDMGEHTAPADAPELPDGPDDVGDPGAFDNTLIQGFIGDADSSRLAFVEPMITREFLRNFNGNEEYSVPQPDAYPHDQRHPTKYRVRDVPSKDVIAVVLEKFEQV